MPDTYELFLAVVGVFDTDHAQVLLTLPSFSKA
jgi:hypothetical protein